MTLILFASCKTDPNKQVDEGTVNENKYHSNEIGWTIEIPKGWNVTQRGEPQIKEANEQLEIRLGSDRTDWKEKIKELISFQKDRRHVFSATSEKFELEYRSWFINIDLT